MNNPIEPMSNTEARQVFDDIIDQQVDPDRRAALELGREYFCNPAFRAELQANMFAATFDDMPLFSGTAPRQTIQPFVERPTPPKQGQLF